MIALATGEPMPQDKPIEALLDSFAESLSGKKRNRFLILKLYAEYKALEEAHDFGNFLSAHLDPAGLGPDLTRFFEANEYRYAECAKALSLLLKKELRKD